MHRLKFHHWSCLLLSSAWMLSGIGGYAQNTGTRSAQSSDLQSRARELNAIYRNKAIDLLSTYLDASRFYVEVDVVPRVSGAPVDLPYIPKNGLNLGGNSKMISEVQDLISSVRVVLRLPADLSIQTQKQLSDIVFRELPLDRWRGDSVSIRVFHIKDPSVGEASQSTKHDRPKKHSNTNSHGTDGTVQLQSSPPPVPIPALFEIESWSKLSFWHLLGLAVALVIGIFGLVSAVVLARGLISIGGGLRTVSGSMDKSSAATISVAHSRALATARLKPKPIASRQREPQYDRVMHVHSAASVDRQIRNIQTKIKSALSVDGAAVGCAIELANRYLATADESPKAVVLFELVPDTSGQDIYTRLGAVQRRQLQIAAQSFQSGLNKPSLTLSVGDEFLALMRSRSLSQTESASSHLIREHLSRTDDRDVARLLPAINADVLPRFIYYIDPQRLAAILTQVHTNDASFANRVSWALLSLPNVESKLHLDQSILNLLDAMGEMVKRREANRYFPHLQKVVENLPPRLRTAISESLTMMSEDFGKFMGLTPAEGADSGFRNDVDPSPLNDVDNQGKSSKNDQNAA